jgi:hypothetical protein
MEVLMVSFSGSPGQHWSAYGAVFLAMLVAAIVPAVLRLLGAMLGIWSADASPAPARDAIIPPEAPLNTRYFTPVRLGGILALPAFALIPFFEEVGARTSFVVLSVCLMLGGAIVYANRKGDLRWDDGFEREPHSKEQAR